MGVRGSNPAFNDGNFEIIDLESSGIGPWGFMRVLDGHKVLALYKFSSKEQEVS
jgi:hypothetical protein